MTSRLIILLALAFPACSGTWEGSGSGTLYVVGEIKGKPGSTEIEVEVHSRGASVDGANVVIRDLDTEAVSNLEAKKDGRYTRTLGGWVQSVELQITSGDDELVARLRGPDPHVVTRPPNDAVVRRGTDEVLTVLWEAEDSAEVVTLKAKGLAPVRLEDDPKRYDLPLGGLEQGEQKIEVERSNSVDLAGGTEGSNLRSRYAVDNRFRLEG